ncbi:MarR family transcriptional regulator [Parvibaculum sp.]|uniref:MarR family transcriptional regulator n=1 Tax=Parvibaculum sp. TaxID=2024848 RepID=UPI000C95FCBF|nr:MarR family transcriptional regulator [Parvibaculum sp.]MAB12436.1 MarR family transcriptional regulator [Parvibaculum sp.]
MTDDKRYLPPYRQSLAGTLLAAREAVMGPIRPMLREVGLTDQQWRVLRVLVDQGPVDASTLARAALLYAPTVTRILRDLVARGLVERFTNPADGRRSIIKISPQGRAIVDRTAKRTRVVLDQYAERFGPSRLAALQTELVALVEAIGEGEELLGEE